MSVFPRKWQTKQGQHKAWYVQFMVNGQTVHQVAIDPDTGFHAQTKREAQDIEAKLRQRLASGRASPQQLPTVQDFIVSVYLPWAEINHTASHYQSDRWRTQVIIQEFGALRFDQVSTFAVERFKKTYLQSVTKRGRTRSPASVNRCLQLLSKLFSMAEERKLVERQQRPDIKLLREDNKRLRYLSLDEERRLRPEVEKCGQYLLDLTIVWLNTGLRASEIFQLEVEHVDFHLNVIHVLKTKNGMQRQVPIYGECLDTLRRLCERQSGLVFPSPVTGGKLDNVKKGFMAACRRAGIAGVTPHTLRHTYGTRLAAARVDVVTIKDLMGHRSLSTTMRYLHAVAENKHQAVQRLTEYVSRTIHA